MFCKLFAVTAFILFEHAQQDAAVGSQHRSEYQGNDGHQLQQDVHGRSGSILEGVAYGVAGNRRFVGVGTFAAVNTGLWSRRQRSGITRPRFPPLGTHSCPHVAGASQGGHCETHVPSPLVDYRRQY